ncbi:ABC transporter substrate-binding protein [Bacillus solimangrovi]|uniref:ABC transporter substrate-binding protein n=1 Tax=Bacillus solimangrovi TaxID=1305675 RepID=A0A1E5LDQ6_9BACI|nr:ABC transporter substrate-binding protein [Bacillus solimangrovi]OEH92223.1 ABC transporter substrate-binding protein [Bacillus solimangrovi]
MKKLLVLIVGLFLLSACSADNNNNETTQVNLNEMSWEEIERAAEETEVRLYMWGGDSGINEYIDDYVTVELKNKHNMTLTRVPLDTNEFLQKLLTEKKAEKDKGTIDVIWINGENFKSAKENDLLYGPFASKLPSVQNYIGAEAGFTQSDMGTTIDELEAPWGNVQFVMNYDASKVDNPPKSFEELKSWVAEHPGKFTYPEPTDFTGNAFIRHLLYETTENHQKLQKPFEDVNLTSESKAMWDTLNELEPDLWRNGETYPVSLSQLDQMYSSGEVWMTMGFNEARAESLIAEGVFPESTKSYVFNEGSIGNTHYLSIPYNSPNPAGAAVAINFLLSPEAQLKKLDSSMWGDGTVLDYTKLEEQQKNQIELLSGGQSVVPRDVLKEKYLPELDTSYLEWIKDEWYEEVVEK